MALEEIGRYDPYTDKFIKNTTTDRIDVGTDESLHNLSMPSSYGLYYAKNQEELDKCDYIDKSTKLYTKNEVITILTELQSEIKKTYLLDLSDENNVDDYEDFAHNRLVEGIISLIQQKVRKYE